MHAGIALVVLALLLPNIESQRYEPNWDSLDSRPLPEWFDKAKIGIFIHWGVFSVPSFFSEWFWNRWKIGYEELIDFMEENYPPHFTYQEFAKDFKAEFFNATEWAELFKKSGAKYVVLTSKHHEGFAMWPSKYSFSWNAKDIGPRRDIVGELGDAVRAENLTYGLYHSLFEWFNPMWLADQASNFTTQDFARNKILPEMRELIETYQPSILWSDGDEGAIDTYWDAMEFLAWLYNDSPVKDVVVTNDRWGTGIGCNHGGFYSCYDRYNPGTILPYKWENAMTIDKTSWGFRRNARLEDYFTINELLEQVVSTVSCGGNILINIGPTKEGTIVPIYQERLTQLGKWLGINGEAIYETIPWLTAQNDFTTPGVWYTSKHGSIYAIALQWPKKNVLALKSSVELFQNTDITVTLVGNEDDGNLEWKIENSLVYITFPNKATAKSEWAWVLKISPSGTDSSASRNFLFVNVILLLLSSVYFTMYTNN